MGRCCPTPAILEEFAQFAYRFEGFSAGWRWRLWCWAVRVGRIDPHQHRLSQRWVPPTWNCQFEKSKLDFAAVRYGSFQSIIHIDSMFLISFCERFLGFFFFSFQNDLRNRKSSPSRVNRMIKQSKLMTLSRWQRIWPIYQNNSKRTYTLIYSVFIVDSVTIFVSFTDWIISCSVIYFSDRVVCF